MKQSIEKQLQDVAIVDKILATQYQTCAVCGRKIDPIDGKFAVVHAYSETKINCVLLCEKCCNIKLPTNIDINKY